MTRTFTQLLAIALVAVLSFTACSKSTQSITKNNLIGTYTVLSVTERTANGPEYDVIGDYLSPCQYDDLMILRSDLTIQYVDAGTTCVPSSNDIGEWDLVGSTFYWDRAPYTVRSLSNSTLVIEESHRENLSTVTTTVTFNRN